MFANGHFSFDDGGQRTVQDEYFQGNKKNQLNDMKDYLRRIVTDPQKQDYRRQLVKRIILFTTSGIDTSRLYPEMVLACATKDIVEKKLIFMYLAIYSQLNEDFARMAINTFMKDCYSLNPNIRSLAIRHLSNLRFKGREEYILPILKAGLDDYSPMVKRSCVMGIVKLSVEKNRLAEQPVRDQDILNKLYELIRENDPQLICTVLEAINEIELEGIAMSKKLFYYLLNNLNDFGDLQLVTVLNYLELYQLQADEQIQRIIGAFGSKMKSSSLSVVLGLSKIFLKFIKHNTEYTKSILKMIKDSLMTFFNHDCHQIEYVALKHIEYLITRYPTDQTFTEDFRKYVLGSNDPTYLKACKIRILQLCITKKNLADVANEFVEYLTDQNLCHDTIQALSKTIIEVDEQDAKFIVKTLVKVLQQSPKDFLCNTSLPLIRNYLRKYPNQFSLFVNIFYPLIKNSTEDQACCAMIQIIGDYGQLIEDAIELIAWSDSTITDNIQISLLRANVKLFLKRPQEMVNMISHMFKNILNSDQTHLQVKDYAAFLYRGLAQDFDQFQKLFLDRRIETIVNKAPLKNLQFNTLQMVYNNQRSQWLLSKDKYLDQGQIIDYEDNQTTGQPNQDQPQQQRKQLILRRTQINVDSKYKHLESQNFDVIFILDTQTFQNYWDNFEIGYIFRIYRSSITRIIKNMDLLSQNNLEELFKVWNIKVMASAQNDDQIKLYLYCKVFEVNGDLGIACMEFCILKLAETMTLMVKSDNEELAGFISRYVEQFLLINEIV